MCRCLCIDVLVRRITDWIGYIGQCQCVCECVCVCVCSLSCFTCFAATFTPGPKQPAEDSLTISAVRTVHATFHIRTHARTHARTETLANRTPKGTTDTACPNRATVKRFTRARARLFVCCVELRIECACVCVCMLSRARVYDDDGLPQTTNSRMSAHGAR